MFAGRESDIYVYEAHGVSVCSGVALDPIDTDAKGRLDLDQLANALPEDPDDPQFSIPSVVCVENTANRAGGVPLTPADLAGVVSFAERNALAVHLDGARIFNAAVALGFTPAELAARADSVQFCLSKGLCAPIGSMVTGSAEFIVRTRRVRKMLGGGMRQAGVIAAAGLVALDTMIDRLAEDHVHAARLADGLATVPGLAVDPVAVRTNMVMFRVLDPALPHGEFIARARGTGSAARRTRPRPDPGGDPLRRRRGRRRPGGVRAGGDRRPGDDGVMSEAARYDELGCWVVADHDAAKAAFGHPALSSRTLRAGYADRIPATARESAVDLVDVLGRWYVLLDGEAHRAARRAMAPVFAPGAIRRFEERAARDRRRHHRRLPRRR